MTDQPFATGEHRAAFIRDMENVCSQLISVATDYQQHDPRTCLSAYICPPTCNGFLLAVRESQGTPAHILQMAQELHDAIQQHYRSLGNTLTREQSSTSIGDTNESGSNDHYHS